MNIVKMLLFIAISISLSGVEFESMGSNFSRQKPQKNVIYSYYDSIKNARMAVVNISTTKTIKSSSVSQMPLFNDPFFQEFFGRSFGEIVPKDRVQRALGSGVIVSSDGYIITNNHVVGDADTISVTLPNDSTKEYKAKLIGTDPKSDIAVIKINEKNLNYVKFADSDMLKIGDVVFAIGNPFGVGETVTSGIVSALNKSGVGINAYENFIQTDASINPGNSGGALVDSRGALVGINSAIISKSGGNVGIGFAIPSNMARAIAKALIEKGKVQRGYLGVSIGDLTNDLKEFYKEKGGAFIVNVQKDSPAEKAGLKRGDLIIKIDNKRVKNSSDLRNQIGLKNPNSVIKITYIRNKKTYTTKATLSSLDDSFIAQEDGLRILNGLTVTQGKDGVVIKDVKDGSVAQEKGFLKGDVILQIEDVTISNITILKQTLRKYKNMKKRVYIQRGNSIWVIVVS